MLLGEIADYTSEAVKDKKTLECLDIPKIKEAIIDYWDLMKRT